MSKLNIGVVTVRSANGETGGAERFYESLVDSFQRIGHAATEIIVEADERDFDHIQRNYLACYDLNLQEFDCVISTKAPTWMVRHPRHVCYLVHTVRVFYDMFTTAFPQPTEELFRQQELVHSLDTGALRAPRCKAIFSIGHEVASRLRQYNSLESEVLHPPLWTDDFYEGVAADYILMPGRLHPWKRVDLVVNAMRYVDAPLQLYIVGTGEAESDLKSRASGDGRIKFLGRIADAELKRLYSNALAVAFTPNREDYGYVTLEAYASGKPVLTCTDSGEPAALVRNGETGYVCEPSPEAIAECLKKMRADHLRMARMGREGKEWVRTLSWENIARRLIAAAMGQV